MTLYKTIILTLLLGAASCSKIIDIDYESIDSMHVVVAEFSAEGGSVIITRTYDMDEAIQNEVITSASSVTISDESGRLYPLEPNELGLYNTMEETKFSEGYDYTLRVEIDDRCYTSTSHLFAAPTIGSISFSSQQFTPEMNLTFCTFEIEDRVGEQNYYRYRFRYEGRDDESWSLAKEGVDGEPISLMTHLYTMDRELVDGDTIYIDVQAIDKSSYEYLYTLALSGSSSTNPITNFEGGCLGYFMIYSTTTTTAVLANTY